MCLGREWTDHETIEHKCFELMARWTELDVSDQEVIRRWRDRDKPRKLFQMHLEEAQL